MRVIGLQAENIKALRAVDIVPRGDVVQIVGANGAGKSSVLDCIFYALAGKKAIPSKPIRKGEESAVIKLDLGEVIVTRKFTSTDTSVFVEAASGARFPSPQRLLDDLLGELSFDPLKFALAEPNAQLETLRGMVKLEVDIDALDGQNARDYELRRDWNRKVASLTEREATLRQGIDAGMDVDPIDVDALTEQMATASEHNTTITQLRARREQMARSISSRHEAAEALRAQARALIQQAEENETSAAQDQETLDHAEPLAEMIDISDLRQQLNEAMKANALKASQQRQRDAHRLAADELTAARVMSQSLTKLMEDRTAQKQAAIAAAKMPVPGLGFGEGEVLFNGIPFSQASSAERIRVSCAIAMAGNPKLRVALIRDGSLLDDNNLALIAQMAAENQFQVFVERVDTTGKIGILIQDGAVAAIDGVPVAEFAAEGAAEPEVAGVGD